MRFSLWRAWAFALRERSGTSLEDDWGSGEGDASRVAEVLDLVGGMADTSTVEGRGDVTGGDEGEGMEDVVVMGGAAVLYWEARVVQSEGEGVCCPPPPGV